jgi:hypothetical protein
MRHSFFITVALLSLNAVSVKAETVGCDVNHDGWADGVWGRGYCSVIHDGNAYWTRGWASLDKSSKVLSYKVDLATDDNAKGVCGTMEAHLYDMQGKEIYKLMMSGRGPCIGGKGPDTHFHERNVEIPSSVVVPDAVARATKRIHVQAHLNDKPLHIMSIDLDKLVKAVQAVVQVVSMIAG